MNCWEAYLNASFLNCLKQGRGQSNRNNTVGIIKMSPNFFFLFPRSCWIATIGITSHPTCFRVDTCNNCRIQLNEQIKTMFRAEISDLISRLAVHVRAAVIFGFINYTQESHLTAFVQVAAEYHIQTSISICKSYWRTKIVWMNITENMLSL